jgi:hypothetical protein
MRRPRLTTKGVRPISLFVCVKSTMGMGKISESVVYKTVKIKKVSVQTHIQLVGKLVYIGVAHRKKIPVEEERHPINLKEK